MIWEIRHGDALELMRELEPASVDAIVSDPPYGLSFMGKDWDHGIPGVPYWSAALRVAKHGAHLCAFGGTRTYHRLACAIEDAGWEIRDCLSWLYGSGFPKSLDVSKAIDKARDDSAAVLRVTRWLNSQRRRAGIGIPEVLRAFNFNEGSGQVGHWTALTVGAQPTVPTWDQWVRLRSLLNLPDEMDAEVWRLNGRKGTPGEAWRRREFYDKPTGGLHGGSGNTVGAFTGRQAKPGGVTDAAHQWQGWGTALKPAWEPIILARKPLSGTVAANVQQHGTGALNVDGCRIGTEALPASVRGVSRLGTFEGADGNVTPERAGRWPANVCLDEAAAAMLDEQSGELQSGSLDRSRITAPNRTYGAAPKFRAGEYAPNAGGASRFFYTAKASTAERQGAAQDRNKHPTVKPLDLMRWLCRLVTPPGGLVLDPFVGSGTTVQAALLEGFRALGFDQDPEMVAFARERIAGPLFASAGREAVACSR